MTTTAGYRSQKNHSHSQSTGLDASLFRSTLSCYASGITIVTGLDDQGPIGFTCQSFYSVSVDPPLVSFSVMKTSTTYPRIRDTGTFTVNVLAREQEAISNQFAGEAPISGPASNGASQHGETRFSRGAWPGSTARSGPNTTAITSSCSDGSSNSGHPLASILIPCCTTKANTGPSSSPDPSQGVCGHKEHRTAMTRLPFMEPGHRVVGIT
jgi:flavin reductase (DIM6/NTAB) family NADH-FMN oxidoreductase RutF